MPKADAGCPAGSEPKDSACVVSNAYGVFVSASASAGGSGTRASPFQTIGAGIAAAVAGGKSRVYVCAGTYAEAVVLDAQHDGISLYGGLDCTSDWAWTGAKANVQGPNSLYALRIDATTRPIAIEDMGFTVPAAMGQDSTGAGNSSVAAFVSSESAGVSFRRMTLTAGNGADGAAGGTAPSNIYAGSPSGNGADGGAGGPAKTCACPIWGSTQGGAGGAAGDPGGDGGAGSATPTATQPNHDGVGGAGYNDFTGSCLVGHRGADGADQSDGGAGAVMPGALSGSGWIPSAGSDGLHGNPGQGGGGGGGGGGGVLGGGSGGGGCGGCGGAGGPAGHGGGASIALLIFNATVDVHESQIATGTAGQGGTGGAGADAAGGAGGGSGACGGSAGGSGAGGQGGGGGAGGVSVGILSGSGTAAVDSQTTFTLSSEGAGGAAGAGGMGGTVGSDQAPTGTSGSPGVDGVSQERLASP